jgi:hypothetical protein
MAKSAKIHNCLILNKLKIRVKIPDVSEGKYMRFAVGA